jgi:hypothetical protein
MLARRGRASFSGGRITTTACPEDHRGGGHRWGQQLKSGVAGVRPLPPSVPEPEQSPWQPRAPAPYSVAVAEKEDLNLADPHHGVLSQMHRRTPKAAAGSGVVEARPRAPKAASAAGVREARRQREWRRHAGVLGGGSVRIDEQYVLTGGPACDLTSGAHWSVSNSLSLSIE